MRISRLIILGLSVLLVVACLVGLGVTQGSLEQNASRLWQGESDTEFRRVSVYFPSHAPRSVTDLRSIKTEMAARIAEQDETVSFLTAWGGEGESEYHTETRNEWMKTFFVSGDFFAIRNFPMVSGATYPLSEGSVVLNEYAAWKIFGSSDCVGLDLARDDVPMRVAAVVKDGQEDAVVYAPVGEEDPITFFEVILPEFVKNYARDTVTLYLYPDDNTILRENDIRFTWKNLRGELKKVLSGEEQQILFRMPWWEFEEWHGEKVLSAWYIALWGSIFLTTALSIPYLAAGIGWVVSWIKSLLEERALRKKRYE
ncbi:MAG: ABC transporter permease [Clostridia bacterium]|nr:ABC transporter permease [Clostridia bacterium]